ncbi:HopJ type III effector protein [Acinetobacter sp. MD2]|uniref:HopJ type III effector protein n=1 Tax=Acinetobacter sp. MD2 TaxID=2600066 RepID=UPI002D1F6989|nr:HopJ type III effector protein [Acinetobacter sp. MD2]MEB3767033.1 HopJ type III effector protein [Acinetobacter sp. MD2]
MAQAHTLLTQLKAGQIQFKDVIAAIEQAFHVQATAFKNGAQHNAATENQGSAKVFAFAQLQNLNQADTLALFAEHYAAVLATPDATDHQNIRQFMQHGWSGIEFEGQALTPKA